MNVEHTFVTKFESVEAFGLSNELLRPRGFTPEDGNPSRSQEWRRAGNKNARSVRRLPQTLRVEQDRGRVNVRVTMEVSGRRVMAAQKLMMSYARSLEALLAEKKPVKTAGLIADSAERGIQGSEIKSVLRTCVAVVVILAGAGVAYALATGRALPFKAAKPPAVSQSAPPLIPPPLSPALQADPRNQVSAKPADPAAPKKHTAPVITVRKSGPQPQAAAKPTD